MQQAYTWAKVDPVLCRHMVSLGHNELHDPYIGSWSPGQAAGFTTRRTSLWIFTSDIIATTDRSGCTYPGTGLSYHGPNILVISIISCNEPERSAVISVCVLHQCLTVKMIQKGTSEIGTLVTRGYFLNHHWRALCPLIARFMGPTW